MVPDILFVLHAIRQIAGIDDEGTWNSDLTSETVCMASREQNTVEPVKVTGVRRNLVTRHLEQVAYPADSWGGIGARMSVGFAGLAR